MKKIAALSIALLIPSITFAAGNHPMAGCGLGYLLLSNQENDKVMQVLGSTTNGTFGSQTFGISSGTSGCTQDGAVKLARAAEVFAEVNLDSLRRDMAAGQGEYVNAFASLLSTSTEKQVELVRYFHENYTALFPSAETSSADLMARVSATLSQRPDLLS